MDSEPASTGAGIDPAMVLENAHEAFVAMDARGLINGWNRAASAMFGWEPQEVVGRQLSETIIPEPFRRMHEEGLRLFLETGVGPVLGTTIEVEALRRDGELFPVELSITPYPDGQDGYVFGAFLNDVSDRRRLRRWQRASERVGWLLACNERGPRMLADCLAAVGEEMDFHAGLWWRLEEDVLRLGAHWVTGDAYESFIRGSERTFAHGEGLPGTAWATASPIWSVDIATDPRYLRVDVTKELGLHTGIFIPASTDDEVVGVFEFLSADRRSADPALISLLSTFGGQMGTFLARG